MATRSWQVSQRTSQTWQEKLSVEATSTLQQLPAACQPYSITLEMNQHAKWQNPKWQNQLHQISQSFEPQSYMPQIGNVQIHITTTTIDSNNHNSHFVAVWCACRLKLNILLIEYFTVKTASTMSLRFASLTFYYSQERNTNVWC